MNIYCYFWMDKGNLVINLVYFRVIFYKKYVKNKLDIL